LTGFSDFRQLFRCAARRRCCRDYAAIISPLLIIDAISFQVSPLITPLPRYGCYAAAIAADACQPFSRCQLFAD